MCMGWEGRRRAAHKSADSSRYRWQDAPCLPLHLGLNGGEVPGEGWLIALLLQHSLAPRLGFRQLLWVVWQWDMSLQPGPVWYLTSSHIMRLWGFLVLSGFLCSLCVNNKLGSSYRAWLRVKFHVCVSSINGLCGWMVTAPEAWMRLLWACPNSYKCLKLVNDSSNLLANYVAHLSS